MDIYCYGTALNVCGVIHKCYIITKKEYIKAAVLPEHMAEGIKSELLLSEWLT